MASIYKPEDPLAYAGKSHALFGAGEYMSSALFLSRALEIFPEYAYVRIDIEGMMGSRDNLEGRIADIEEWLKIRNRGELHFLLGYIYEQLGRLERAMESIESAYEMMPDSVAVAILRKAIYGAQKEAPAKPLSS
jgi:tetratricopeptide (TPR) repeat protein